MGKIIGGKTTLQEARDVQKLTNLYITTAAGAAPISDNQVCFGLRSLCWD